MPVVDYERVVAGLKAHIATKRSHGQQELIRKLFDLEIESTLPEGQESFDDRPPLRAVRQRPEAATR